MSYILSGPVVATKTITGKRDGKQYGILSVYDGREVQDVFVQPVQLAGYELGEIVEIPCNVVSDGKLKIFPVGAK